MNSNQLRSKNIDYASSDSIITPQQIYQTLIRQTPNLYPLCKFKTKASNKHFFPDAVKYPNFFNYNLVSPGRVIKRLQGRQSLIRGFYYQLMKLAFQIQVQERDYIEVLKNVFFSPEFMLQENPSSPSSGKNYSDLQYKKIVAEFMQILIHQSIPNFELTILNYPIVDQAMLKILQNLLTFKFSIDLYSNQRVSSFQILQLLSQTFQVTVVEYGNCYKFQQSDIFLYQHSRNQFYIAFLNEMAEMAEMSEMSESGHRKDSSCDQNSSKQIKQSLDSSSGKKEAKTHERIQNDFESQTPLKESQHRCASNQEKQTLQNQKISNSNPIFGLHETKSLESITSNDYESNQNISSKKGLTNVQQRESRQSLVNELHALEHQTYDGHNSNFTKEIQKNNYQVEFPGVQMAKSVSKDSPIHGPIQNYIMSSSVASNYQYQPKGYSKKVTFQTSTKLMTLSNQSDSVIGYSSTSNVQKKIMNTNTDNKFDFLNYYQQKTKIENDNKKQFDYLLYQPKETHNYGLTNTKNQQSLIKKDNYSKWNQQVSKLTSTNASITYNTQKYSLKQQKDDDIFYSPKPLISKPQTFNYQTKTTKNDESVGTLYRQFTETKLLDILPEDVQYNIKKMKRKYKGVHSKDFFGIKKF